MKTLRNILSLLMVPAALALFATGCTNDIMDRINKNPNDPKVVPADFILPQVIAATATSAVGGDLSLYASIYMELEAGIHGQTYNAERRVAEPTSATTYNNSWESIYVNIRDIKDIIRICDDQSTTDGGPIIKGMAQILEAVNLATLTDYFGDVPYSQTAIFDETTGMPVYPQPIVDSQKDLYAAIFKLLDDAETNLKGTGGAPAAANDMIYGGDTKLWIKAVNALRARYTLQLLNASSNASADLDKILGYIDASFESADEQMSFGYDGSNTFNPFGAYFYSRYGIGASQSFVDLLDAKNDPRFVNWGFELSEANTWTDDIYAAPNGDPIEEQLGYSFSFAYLCEWAPVHIISYHELMFIKAEALARKNDASAVDALEEAVLAAFANLDYLSEISAGFNYIYGIADPSWTWSYKLTADDAQSYFDTEVAPAYAANALNEVMIQKYISCMGASGEAHVAYNDYRRMKAMGQAGYLTLANPKNATQFPLRYTYGASDVNNNVNVRELYGNGQYVYTENVWWAGGTK